MVSAIGRFGRLEQALETTRYLRKWVGIAFLIGIVAGLGAIAFALAIEYATRLFLGMGALYLPPAPVGEGATGVEPVGRPWLLPLIVGLGGLISGLIVFTLAPEAEGHGTDSAIAAIHERAGELRARIPPIKLIASAITIGAGGSAGREGPTAQISAAFGSLLAKFTNLGDADRRTAVAIGIGAGVGAIFRAPLGGAVLAAEILYLHDLEVEALIPGLIASIVGYTVYGAVTGFDPIFGNLGQFGFAQPHQLLYYATLGVICGGTGILYARVFYGTTRLFHQLPIPRPLKPAIGGFIVGAVAIVMPQILHTGYGWVQIAMGPGLLGLPLWLVLLLPLAKIVATSLTVGSGGSGGIFGPGMVIGGMTGAAFWRVGQAVLPGMPTDPAPFVIIAMMALFGGIAHAPLAVMLMVAEMTGNLSLLAPAMLAVGLSYLVVGNNTIYASQLPTRADAPAHRVRMSFPLLEALRVRDAMTRPQTYVRPGAPVYEADIALHNHQLRGTPVVDSHDHLVGVITLTDIRSIPTEERDTRRVEDVMTHQPAASTLDETLDVALETLATHHVQWLPVVESRRNPRIAGIITAADIVRAYRNALHDDVRDLRIIAGSGTVVEVTISPAAPVAGKPLRDLHLTPQALVVSIRRNDERLAPQAETLLQPGDVVTVVSQTLSKAAVRRLFDGGEALKKAREPV